MIPVLVTERLLLWPIAEADADQIQLSFPRWDIVRYMNIRIPWPYPADGARTFCSRATSAMESGDEWHWSIRVKPDQGQLIGVVSLTKDGPDNRGFWISTPWQGRGFASEVADAVTDYWFRDLGFPVLRTSKAVANTPSRRISERQGMTVVATEERDYIGGRMLGEVWQLTAEDWLKRRR